MTRRIADKDFTAVGWSASSPNAAGSRRVRCRERLGGLLRYYHQEAA